jgi:hypothetical protein
VAHAVEIDLGLGDPPCLPQPFSVCIRACNPARHCLRERRERCIRQNRKSADEAADWVHKNLAAKNTLIDADADLVEAGFRERLATIEVAGAAARHGEAQSGAEEGAKAPTATPFHDFVEEAAAAPIIPPLSPGLRRRVATKTIRLRDKEHCRFITTQPCIVCGRTPSEAHHIRFAQPRALGRKVSDEYTVPVCRLHHRELHAYGDEASWWAAVSIDPLPIALELWQRSRAGLFLAGSDMVKYRKIIS